AWPPRRARTAGRPGGRRSPASRRPADRRARSGGSSRWPCPSRLAQPSWRSYPWSPGLLIGFAYGTPPARPARLMQLHQVRYFLAVAREGSMTRAAERLFVTQPALSEQVRKLERELGCLLFERLGRGVMLTAAGEAFRGHAERAVYELE